MHPLFKFPIMKLKVLFCVLCFFLSSATGEAQISIPFLKEKENVSISKDDYIIDEQNNIVVSKIVENIGGKQPDIYALAKGYLIDAYEETKYQIVKDDVENGTVVGEGTYGKFFKMNIFPNTFYLDAVFQARIDSKDGRARISLHVRQYGGQCINGNEVEEISDNISDFHPINSSKNERKKLYGKAFPVLVNRMKATVAKIEEALRNGSVATNNNDW